MMCLVLHTTAQVPNLSKIDLGNTSFRPKLKKLHPNLYSIDNINKVKQNKEIVSKTVTITAGGLYAALTSTERSTVTNLTIKGTIDARDFKTLRDNITYLSVLDLSGSTINSYTGNGGTDTTGVVKTYVSNAIPQCAFWNPITQVLKTGLTSIIFPGSITAIGDNAFLGCRNLNGFILPNTITKIGEYAFFYCSSLTAIDIPASINEIKPYTFSRTSINNVTIPSTVTLLDEGVFWDCQQLKSANVSAAKIDVSAFDSCTVLNAITINPTVKSIEAGAFELCKSLTAVNIPSTVDYIGEASFYKCTGLKTATVASSSIGKTSFFGCVGLNSVTMTSSVNNIDNSVFNGCTGLSSIYALRSTPVILSTLYTVFSNVNKTTCTLYVPKGSKALYQAAFQWKDFTNIVETTTAIPTLLEESIKIYPNPVIEVLRIEGINGLSTILLSDLNGRELLSKRITDNENISVSEFPKGFYLVKIDTNEGSVEKKILKK